VSPLAAKLVDLIANGVTRKRWIYWPPGPMLGQVFDREQCAKDVDELVTAELGKLEQRVIALTPPPALLKQLGEQIQDLRRMRFFRCSTNGCKTDAPTCEACLFLAGLTNTLEQFAALDATKAPHDGDTRQKVSG
jgi:hypothetical protein